MLPTCELTRSIYPALTELRGTPSTAGTCHTEQNWNYRTPVANKTRKYGAV
jgi:hypothetical protein